MRLLGAPSEGGAVKRLRSFGAAFLLASLLSVNSHAAQKIVTFTPGASTRDGAAGLEKLGCKVMKYLPLINAVVAEFPEKVLEPDILACPHVCAVEEDRVIKWIEEAPVALPLSYIDSSLAAIKAGDYPGVIPVPAEPRAAATSEIPWGVKRVNAPSAWATTMGQGVKVGIIDTGMDYAHPDLKANYAGGYNAIDASKPPLDDNGHGTHVAGIIGAVSDGVGVIGVAPSVSLYAVKVLNAQGSGAYSAIIDGIQWAVTNKMAVVNMSLGSPSGSTAIQKAIEAAYKAGVTLVVAAGNDSGPVNYPAKYPQAIAVAASDSADKIASFSSRGAEIAVIAPGVAINSTYMGGIYKSLSGTSMASPHVAGLAALAVARGAKTPAAVRKALQGAATGIGLQPAEQGAGLVDAGKLVK